MKHILTSLFAFLTISLATTQAAEIVYSQFRDTDSFKRISEHITGDENPGRYAITRTHPENRDGHYIAIKIEKSDQARQWSTIRIQVVKPGTQEAISYDLPISVKGKSRALIGLTDTYWGNGQQAPLAWKADMLDAQGNTLASAQSFLWSPAK